jgi:hypothetical protein
MVHYPSKFKQTARAKQRTEEFADYVARLPFRCGDKVRHADNPRHVGTVTAIWTHAINVTWECGIKETLRADEPLILHERAAEPFIYRARYRSAPATEAVSPKRKLEKYFAELQDRRPVAPAQPAAEPEDLSAIIQVVSDNRRRTGS